MRFTEAARGRVEELLKESSGKVLRVVFGGYG